MNIMKILNGIFSLPEASTSSNVVENIAILPRNDFMEAEKGIFSHIRFPISVYSHKSTA